MAVNAASHNPFGEKTGPVSGQPPAPSDETKAAINGSVSADPIGQHASGQDTGVKSVDAKAATENAAEGKVKSEKELKKEREKAEKLRKFQEKQAKTQADKPQTGGNESKTKEKKVAQAKAPALAPYVEETKAGDMKILKPLDDEYHKAYVPKVVESAWYSWWEKEGFFKPEFTAEGKVKPAGYFAMPIPPPNVTGSLHIGHALTNALQDTMTRWYRMKGRTTLWLPGCDHAGIATQVVVEKMLWKRQKKTRHDLGRTKFIELVQDWKEEYHSKINATLRRLGSSYDWERERFTMDDEYVASVSEMFIQLHEDGTIYRANKLVNWCCQLRTALSNIEVINKEIDGKTLMDVPGYDRKVEFGVLTHFKYPIEGSDEFIQVATTRPETMLGDTAIAVHPNDKRYTHLLGKHAKHPFLDRLIPIIADDYVEMDFGTGAVKITPAHDANDFAIGTRHKLEFINIFTDDGLLNEHAGPEFQGMKRFDARYEVIKRLQEAGLYVKWENNKMVVPTCERSKDVIEPLIKPQWWMSMKPLAEKAVEAVKNGDVKIRPETAEKDFIRWMNVITDWCLSRQLWWGHQIPMYYVRFEGEENTGQDDNERWIAGRNAEEAHEKASKKFPGQKFTLTRDEDVLDTWFSSGMWPFATLGWPKKTSDFENLYPQSILETGWDILFFWVARMIMLGIKMTGKVPFKEVYCHTLVRDSEGRKMSKSLGNVIDPVDVMEGITLEDLHAKLATGNLDPKEVATATKYQKSSFPDGIPECGADALRFSLVAYTTGGGDINFDIKVMHAYRRFCNKLYQATKYVLGNLDSSFVPNATGALTGKESLSERWILHNLSQASKTINIALEDRQFSDATTALYAYWYNQLCDVYIENSKTIIANGTPEESESAKQTLYTALEAGLRLMHPLMPFLTEELWQRLPRRKGDPTRSITVAAYPEHESSLDSPDSSSAYQLIMDVSQAIRSLTGQYMIKDNAHVYISLSTPTALATIKSELDSIKSLIGYGKTVAEVDIMPSTAASPSGCVPLSVSSEANVYLLVKGRVDIDAQIEKSKSRIEKLNELVKRTNTLMNGQAWKEKASESVKETERKKLEDVNEELRVLEKSVAQFERLKLE